MNMLSMLGALNGLARQPLLVRERHLDIQTPLLRIHGTEKYVNVLELQALGLLDKEEDEDAHAEAEHAKHDECAPADVVDGCGGELCDAEVEEPERGC